MKQINRKVNSNQILISVALLLVIDISLVYISMVKFTSWAGNFYWTCYKWK